MVVKGLRNCSRLGEKKMCFRTVYILIPQICIFFLWRSPQVYLMNNLEMKSQFCIALVIFKYKHVHFYERKTTED